MEMEDRYHIAARPKPLCVPEVHPEDFYAAQTRGDRRGPGEQCERYRGPTVGGRKRRRSSERNDTLREASRTTNHCDAKALGPQRDLETAHKRCGTCVSVLPH